MQPMKELAAVLASLADRDHCVFLATDLAAAVPDCRQLGVLLSRATKAGLVKRVCRGVYWYPVPGYPREQLLYHAAARLRAGEFNFLSLETVLSEAGLISQVPIDWITLMSSGRSHVVNCRSYGRIEFVHTVQRPNEVAGELSWDRGKHLWRASVKQALRDLRATRRPSWELIDEEARHEFV